jgi:hypothetical protein
MADSMNENTKRSVALLRAWTLGSGSAEAARAVRVDAAAADPEVLGEMLLLSARIGKLLVQELAEATNRTAEVVIDQVELASLTWE